MIQEDGINKLSLRKLAQFCNEYGKVIENSIAEKCCLEIEDGNLGMIIMAKDISNPVLLVCGGGPDYHTVLISKQKQ